MRKGGRKGFFFEKKKQKTFVSWGRAGEAAGGLLADAWQSAPTAVGACCTKDGLLPPAFAGVRNDGVEETRDVTLSARWICVS